MRKRWVGLVLLIVLSLGGIVGGHWGLQSAVPERSPTSLVALPQVEPDRLLQHVQSLAFPRVSESERDRTRQYLLKVLQQSGWAAQEQPFAQGINLVAERPGTDPAAGRILLGAHYDTVARSPGADDNATGVATVLEAARLLGTLPTRRTLQLVLFDREETGLEGSIAFVDQLTPDTTPTAAVILDMLGYACQTPGCQTYPAVLPIQPPTDVGDFLAVIGDQGHQFVIDAFVQGQVGTSSKVLTLSIPLLGPLTPDLMRSDHTPFWNNRIGAVLLTDTANFRNPHYHQPSDTPDSLDTRFLAGNAQIVVNALTTLLSQ